MVFLVKVLLPWNKCLKNADISILSNFLVTLFHFFLNIKKFAKYYLSIYLNRGEKPGIGMEWNVGIFAQRAMVDQAREASATRET